MTKDTPSPSVPGAMAMSEARLADELERLRDQGIAEAKSTGKPLRAVDAWVEFTRTLTGNADDIIAALRESETLRAQVREGEKVRAEALEEAAKICERVRDGMIGDDFSEFECVEDECAHEIRALAPQPAPTEGGKE